MTTEHLPNLLFSLRSLVICVTVAGACVTVVGIKFREGYKLKPTPDIQGYSLV
jgi:hypothetical protein